MSKFITYADFSPDWPIQPPPSREKIISWSKHGLFPKFFRPAGNRKAEPLFEEQAVKNWLRDAYAPMFRVPDTRAKTRNK
ncbi:MAG TPA: hypothetical protein VIJ62_15055 [Rhizomicrobium sp.]